MAVALAGTPTNVASGSNYTPESGSNRCVVLLAMCESASNRTLNTPTLGGVNGTLGVREGGTNGGVENVEFWRWKESEIGAGALATSATWSGTANGSLFRWYTFTGVDQTTPIEDTATSEAASGTTGTITGGIDTSSMILAANVRSGSTASETWTSPLSTETNAASGSVYDYTTGTGTGSGAGTTVELTWTTSRNWAACAIALKAASSGYTLTAAAGRFTLTGIAAGLRVARKLTAAQATFTLTGNAAGLSKGFRLTASAGAFTLTGQAAALRVARKLTANTASFTLTGNDAGLTYSGASQTLVAETGTFTLTGNAAGLRVSRKLLAEAASFSLTGNAATLSFGGYRLRAETGVFTLTGNDAQLSTTSAPPVAEPAGGHYYPTPKRKKRKSRLDEQTADRAELRQAIEQAARPIVEQAVEAAPAVPEVPAVAPERKPRRAKPAPRIDIDAIAARAARVALDERKAELSKRAHAAVLALLEDMAVGIIEDLVEDEMRDA